MTEAAKQTEPLLQTPLHALHVSAGARMVPFAGYDMPVQYKKGVMAEHLHTRSSVGLFDVSHMGHIRIRGNDQIAAFEKLVLADLRELPVGTIKYSIFTTPQGGAIDDLMITREEDGLYLIVNASRKDVDYQHIRAHLPADRVEYLDDRALLALQGPRAAEILSSLISGAGTLKFMHTLTTDLRGIPVSISRSGYTGEDGYEITVAASRSADAAQLLLSQAGVEWIGLGARDTLRLEAGLCLYGHELDETTTPIEADLKWVLGKRRRAEGGFLGDSIILDQLKNGVKRVRVGIRPEGRTIAREQTEIQDSSGRKIGLVTSGTFGPSVNGPIAIGYVETKYAAEGSKINLIVRGAAVPATVAKLPFTPYRYYRG